MVTITDSEGDHTFEVRNGADGGLADSILWENVVDKPALALEEHTHTAEEVGAMPGTVYENDGGVKFSVSDNPISYGDGEDCETVITVGHGIGGSQPAIAFTNKFNRQILTIQKTGSKIYRCNGDLLRKSMIYDEANPPTAEAVGARPNTWVPSMSDIEGLEDSLASAGKVKTVNMIEADENGNIEITASDLDAIYVERTEEDITANPPLIDADTLGGISHDQYALKQDIPNLDDVQVTWDEVQNVPSEFSPTAHGHDIGDISGISYEEWVFTYEDGSTETKKVILGV